ncbi:MAG: hypothetical protein MUO97_03785 [Dehalococcoidia bacterium]|nr:hypothetical protein [Dehalococcoidia bacterium]
MAKSVSSSSKKLSIIIEMQAAAASGGVTTIPSPVSIEERVGMRIRSIEYHTQYGEVNSIAQGLVAPADKVNFGFSFLAAMPTGGFKPTTPGLIDFKTITNQSFGAAASGGYQYSPMVTDMTLRDPEGVLVHPANIYFWYYTTNALAAITQIYADVYYQSVAIDDKEWEQLWKQIFVTQAG